MTRVLTIWHWLLLGILSLLIASAINQLDKIKSAHPTNIMGDTNGH